MNIDCQQQRSEHYMSVQSNVRVKYAVDKPAAIKQNSDTSAWTHKKLSTLIQSQLGHRHMVIVANREPLISCPDRHQTQPTKAVSGLVSALFPFIVSTGGTWVSHASGQQTSTDFEDFGTPGLVEPGEAEFAIRRVVSDENQYRQYYENFSNKGLWPLCHVAFTKPNFTAESWAAYRQVNQHFADTVLNEVAGRPAIVFVQDYHLALLPLILKQAKRDIIVAQFWHIPWPPWDIFRTCPNHQQLLEGLLGNDLLGFQLPEHCQNFMACSDASPKANTNHERTAELRLGHQTEISQFPISIDVSSHQILATGNSVSSSMTTWSERLDCKRIRIGLGVERLDYTKGIPQRLKAIRLLLANNRELIEHFTFVQIATLSRLALDDYKELKDDIIQLADAINLEFGTEQWQPILLELKSYNQVELIALERLASFCMVSSLHDGMNLVAKEFCASRVDNRGVLILSKFTGSALELDGAILVNPFSIEMLAEAMDQALAMDTEEMEERMKRMRSHLSSHNVYQWGADLISHLIKIDGAKRP
jgi:trehalose 6-phosphate synthase